MIRRRRLRRVEAPRRRGPRRWPGSSPSSRPGHPPRRRPGAPGRAARRLAEEPGRPERPGEVDALLLEGRREPAVERDRGLVRSAGQHPLILPRAVRSRSSASHTFSRPRGPRVDHGTWRCPSRVVVSDRDGGGRRWAGRKRWRWATSRLRRLDPARGLRPVLPTPGRPALRRGRRCGRGRGPGPGRVRASLGQRFEVHASREPGGLAVAVRRSTSIATAGASCATSRGSVRSSRRHTTYEGLDEHLVVVDALRRLPEAQREVLALHYLADLPVLEIAWASACPRGRSSHG